MQCGDAKESTLKVRREFISPTQDRKRERYLLNALENLYKLSIDYLANNPDS